MRTLREGLKRRRRQYEYEVTLARKVVEFAQVRVTASSHAEAYRVALRLADDNDDSVSEFCDGVTGPARPYRSVRQ